jgi:hypothetical protein
VLRRAWSVGLIARGECESRAGQRPCWTGAVKTARSCLHDAVLAACARDGAEKVCAPCCSDDAGVVLLLLLLLLVGECRDAIPKQSNPKLDVTALRCPRRQLTQ